MCFPKYLYHIHLPMQVVLHSIGCTIHKLLTTSTPQTILRLLLLNRATMRMRGLHALSVTLKFQQHSHSFATGLNLPMTMHFYTLHSSEISGNLKNFHYKYEGVTGYCFPQPGPNLVPLYRYYISQAECGPFLHD